MLLGNQSFTIEPLLNSTYIMYQSEDIHSNKSVTFCPEDAGEPEKIPNFYSGAYMCNVYYEVDFIQNL